MNYFKFYPTINYTFRLDSGVLSNVEITNITERVKLAERLKANITVLYDYVVQDGMRPDSVSQALYGSPSYTWLILIINNIFTLFDWPLTTEEFHNYIEDCYGSVLAAQSKLLYKNAAGYMVDATTYTNLNPADRGAILSAYDDDFEKNELKRRIRIVPAEFVVELSQELKKIL